MAVRARRPLHASSFALAGAHNAFELGAGVGLILQRELGLRRAAAFWAVSLPALGALSRRGSSRWDGPLAAAAGASLGALCVHYTLWPWELRGGLPVLLEAEGLEGRPLALYNALLCGWGVAGVLAIALEVPPRHRRTALLGFAAALPLRAHARTHLAWVGEQARCRPAWWNRALREP